VEAKLGEGGMGVVYRAVQADGRPVALKFLIGQEDLTENAIARFKREMQVLMELSHPNVIRVYDAGDSDGKLFYAMEMLEAHDLADVLKQSGPFAPTPLASVLAQVLDALAYIHARRLVHRDIKPANIMLERGGRAVLMDFGLVRKVGGTMLTAEGKLLGTPRYFPPECIRGGEGTPAGDVWSLGVSAYELLTGERPFVGENLQQLAMSICRDEPAPLAAKRPDAPAPLVRVIHRMLEKDPAHRYGTAEEALAALKEAVEPQVVERSTELSRELLAGIGEPTRRPEPRSRPSVKARRPRITSITPAASAPPAPSRLAPAALAVALVACVAAAIVIHRRAVPATPATVGPPLDRVDASYDAPERLVVRFTTAAPSRWSVDGGGISVGSDDVTTTQHRIEVPADVMDPPRKLLVMAQGQTLEVDPPRSPAQRVHALDRTLASLHADEKATDDLWERMRKQIPRWVISPGLHAGGEGGLPPGYGASPEVAQTEIRAHPDIGNALDGYLRGLRGNAAVKQDLDAVLALSPALLADEHVPRKLRDDLLGTLFRLEVVDALAEYIGRPPPFGILDRVRQSFSLEAADLGWCDLPARTLALGPDQELIYTPPAGSNGVTIHDPKDNFMNFNGVAASTIAVLEPSLAGWSAADTVTLKATHGAGPAGRTLTLWIYGLSAQLYVWVVPDGYQHGLPVRLRAAQHGLTHLTRLDVRLRGPLAEPSAWTLANRRYFAMGARLYYGVVAAAAQPMVR